MHENSLLIFKKYVARYIADGMRVLEVGPDNSPSTYRRAVEVNAAAWDTVDMVPNPNLTFVATSPYSFPVADNSYDMVLSGNVIEHVSKTWVWMRELARIVRPGGLIATITPVSWPYHEAPQDCWRIYPEGMRALSDEVGLVVEEVWWGSLEEPLTYNVIPGRSADWQPRQYRETTEMLAESIGFPLEKAFDTVCVARKPV